MKITLYILLVSIIQCIRFWGLIIMFCLGIIFILFNSFERLLILCQQKIHKISVIEIKAIKRKKIQKGKVRKQEKTVAPIHMTPKNLSEIVGRSRTTFIDALDLKNKKEVLSREPLNEDTQENIIPELPDIHLDVVNKITEDEDLDPDDIEVSITSMTTQEMLMKEEPEIFENTDKPSEEFSSGATFEQLNNTFDILSTNTLTNKNVQGVREILVRLEGTPLFDFIAVHDKCKEKVRLLMKLEDDEIKNDLSYGQDGDFIIGHYLP